MNTNYFLAKHLITSILIKDPRRRPMHHNILSHQFITGVETKLRSRTMSRLTSIFIIFLTPCDENRKPKNLFQRKRLGISNEHKTAKFCIRGSVLFDQQTETFNWCWQRGWNWKNSTSTRCFFQPTWSANATVSGWQLGYNLGFLSESHSDSSLVFRHRKALKL